MTKQLNRGDMYTHIVTNPSSPICGKWVVLYVLDICPTYGYLRNDGIYVLHNDSGPAFIAKVFNSESNIYALHGIIYEKEEWLKRIRENKLKRILTINNNYERQN